MKVLYVLNDVLKYGGTESVCINYLYHIDREKIQIDFLLHAKKREIELSPICQKLINEGIKIFCVTPRKVNIRKNIYELKKFFANNSYDIVHSHADAVSYLILKIAKENGVKHLIAHSHNTNYILDTKTFKGYMHKLFLDFCRYKLRKMDINYMACSVEAGTWLFGKEKVENGEVFILNNAIETKKFKFNHLFRNEIRSKIGIDLEYLIGHVGRFSYQKNHSFIIDVFNELYRLDSNYRLILIGDGENKEQIKVLVRQLNLEDKVFFIGGTADVYKYYSAMDYFIFPSRFEGLPLTTVEAQANGLKCLVTDSFYVSKKLKIVPTLVTYMGIDNSRAWAEYINNNIHYNREVDHVDEIVNSGYDIDIEVKKLQSYYDSLIE